MTGLESRRPVIDVVPFAVVIADADGAATGVNRAWTELTGQTERDWRGLGWLDVCGPDRDARRDELVAAARSGARHQADWVVSDRDQRRRTLHVQAVPDVERGRLVRIVVTATDATEDRARSARLLDQATHDSLTGLLNRAQFLEFLGHALHRRRRAPERVAAVLFVDVDDLKATNDALGHAAGDQVLLDVAARIRAGVRPADIVARYGGDEFTILCEDLGDASEADAIADRIRDSAHGDPPHDVSIGVAIAGDVDADPAAIVADADRTMYLAKRERRRPTRPVAAPSSPREGARPDPRARSDQTDREAGDGLDLLATAAHELRTPLTTIAGFASTLRAHRKRMTPDEVDRAFAILERQTQRLAVMLDQLLDLGRYTHGALAITPVNVADLVTDALEAAPPPDHVTVTVTAGGGQHAVPLAVAVERSAATRLVVNLLTNAYRYGGPNILINSHNGTADVTLSIEDDGPGVPGALGTVMFAPFVRGASNGTSPAGGAGLGLAVARGIAESFGGHLTHERVQPHGARFTVRLPALARHPSSDIV